MTFTIMWIVALIVFCVLEAFTMGILCIWFALGSLFAAITSLFFPIHVQLPVFFVISLVCLLVFRSYALKFKSRQIIPTNADSNIDQIAVVTESIDNILAKGAVYIKGKTWTARSFSDLPIEKDSLVKVIRIEGVKLIVAHVEQHTTV